MPDYLAKALFVVLGLMLQRQLLLLAPHAARPAARLAVHAAMGLTSLLTANMAGSPFGVGVGLNAFTIPVAALLGLPGTALLWALRYLL